MTSKKGGSETDHLVFCNESHIAYGLEVTPDMKEVNSKWDEGKTFTVAPLLAKDQAYKLLWPLSTSLLNNDTELEQNPGYEMK